MKRKHKLLVEITFNEKESTKTAKTFISNALREKIDDITKFEVKSSPYCQSKTKQHN